MYFSSLALKHLRAGRLELSFKSFEILFSSTTDEYEQRTTSWIYGQSLGQFLSDDKTRTIEGYDPPKRIYVKLRG